MATTRLSDLIIPSVYAAYSQTRTKELTAVVQCGALQPSSELDQFLAGGGSTINLPAFNDLDRNDAEDVASDDPAALSTPSNIGTVSEIAVRLTRNKSWGSMDINKILTNEDPVKAMLSLTSGYWAARLQRIFLAVAAGVAANNALATDAYHVQNDMLVNIAGASFTNNTTNFSTSAFIDAQHTMGDAQGDLSLVCVHSIVFARMRKLQLITFVQDATNPAAVGIPFYNGRLVIVDDNMPNTAGVFDSYLFSLGSFRLGMGMAPMPVEFDRVAGAGNGSGQDIFWLRKVLSVHPVGYKWIGTTPAGGPSNANLATAANWQRAYPERKQIGMAILRTREF